MTREVSAIDRFTRLINDYFAPREELEYRREVKDILHKVHDSRVAVEEILDLTSITFTPGNEDDFQREARRILGAGLERMAA